MEIRRYLSIVRRRWLLVVAILAAAIGAGWLVTPRAHTYTASSTLYVGSRSVDINPQSGEVSADRVGGLDRLIATFTALVRTRPIADAAVARADVPRSPDEVVANTTAVQLTETDLIRVSYSDRDPAVSAQVANAIASSLVAQVREFEPRGSRTATDQVISVYEPAVVPGTPRPTGLVRDLILAGLFGLIVAGALLALLEYLDITLHSAADAERQLALPVLAVVPAFGHNLPVPRAPEVTSEFLLKPSGNGGSEVPRA